jgi:hypothetical protein
VFGYFAFRSRIKGVYFSIITQALTFAAMLLFFRNETGFGGNNGFTDFKRILGMPLATTSQMRVLLCVLTGAGADRLLPDGARHRATASTAACCRPSATPRPRHVHRLRPGGLQAEHLDAEAVMCGVAGALYVPQVGIINPGEMSPAASIEIAIWAAVGGRATLIGPIVGAFFVNGAKSWFTQAFPEFWLFFLGALFIAVTLFLPNGMVGLLKRKKDARMTPDLMEAGAEAAPPTPQRQAAAAATAAPPTAAWPPGEPDFAQGVALYLDDITVSFDGFKALNALTLTINVGELRCIIGPNGAGKTTMMDCITGKTRPDSGKVFFGSTIDLLRLSEPDIAQVGVGRKFQKPTVYEQLSVFENLELALRRRPPRARQPVRA